MKARRGEPKRFFQMALIYDSDECCIWPFHRNVVSGYAMMRHEDGPAFVHRLACKTMHGEPPTERHEAAHLCGCGHLGCINPRHLQWKTPKENCADRVSHGTQKSGSAHHAAIITEDDVSQIKKLFDYIPSVEIAMLFGISPQLVCDIKNNRRWSQVKVRS